MTYGRNALHGILLLAVVVAPGTASAQHSEGQSCAEKLTEQLRRFSEKCLADLVSYVSSEPKMAAKIFGETEKFYIVIAREGDGLRAEAVSKFNYPLMKEETAGALKQLGWHPPENESDNWKKHISGDRVRAGAAVEELAKALAAYGLSQGQAMSLTVGTDISS